MKRCLCFDLKHCMHRTCYLLLKSKTRAVCGPPCKYSPPPPLWKVAKLLLPLSSGTCGVLLRKVNGTAIIQLPSKRQMQVCAWVQVGGFSKGGIFEICLSWPG